MHVGIVAQRGNAHAAYLAGSVREHLEDLGVAVGLDRETAGVLDAAELGVDRGRLDEFDLVVSIGGDGTFLYAARGAGTTPVLGVNLGEVGFLNAVAPGDAVDAVRVAVESYRSDGVVPATEVPRIRARGDAGGDDAGWTVGPALNEVVVHGPQRGHGQGLSVELRVDGELYAATHADGVLVATPTGSTAYNLSEGGPLIQPGVDGLVVTLMCPTEPMPPLVVARDSEVTVRVDDADAAVVAGDGRDSHDVTPPALVSVGRADEPGRVAGPGLEFFAALSKLE